MTRRIVFAPDSFKGTAKAESVATALATGWADVRPDDELRVIPMADGGEGTIDAIAVANPESRRVPVTVTGPHNRPVETAWLWLPPTAEQPRGAAVVELACTSGIELLGDTLSPLDAHTLGFGEAIIDALDKGVSQLLLAIGGSSSTDGGAGILRALGAHLRDQSGDDAAIGARGLLSLSSVDLSDVVAPPDGGVIILTDVDSPLTGPRGAASVFGPQKGLDRTAIEPVDSALERWATLLRSDARQPGAGAAGGAGLALYWWGGRLVPGAAAITELVGLARELESADLVVTGEGSFDRQSAAGKAPFHVIGMARNAGLPVAVVAGRIATDADLGPLATSLSLTEIAGSAARAIADPTVWLHEAGRLLAQRFTDE